MKKFIKNKKFAFLIAMVSMFLWGSAFPVLKLTNESLGIHESDYYSKIYVAGIRFMLAGLIVLSLILLFRRKEVKEFKKNFKFLFVLGLISVSIAYFFFYIGVGNTSGMKSSVLQASSTFLVIVFSHFLLVGEKLTSKKIIAIIIGFLGIVIANINKGFDFSFEFHGEGFILINSIVGAMSTIYVKKYGENISSFVKTSGQMLIGSIPLLLIGYFGIEKNLSFNFFSVGLIIYASLISSVAFILWYFLLTEYKASEISFLRLFIPFFGTILSAILLNENLSIYIFLGLILVIIGIIIVNKSNN